MTNKSLYNESKILIDTFLEQDYLKLNSEVSNNEKTLIIVVDMLNGFAKSGALYSKRVSALIPKHVKILTTYDKANTLFMCDAHSEDASEFTVFLPHCIKGTVEAEIVEELQPFSLKSQVIEKNTTNGYLVKAFRNKIKELSLKQIVLIGCCTDLCIQQLALSLKTHYHHLNEAIDIILPIEAVDTYDVLTINHPGNLSHLIALKNMADNGIRLVTLGEDYELV